MTGLRTNTGSEFLPPGSLDKSWIPPDTLFFNQRDTRTLRRMSDSEHDPEIDQQLQNLQEQAGDLIKPCKFAS